MQKNYINSIQKRKTNTNNHSKNHTTKNIPNGYSTINIKYLVLIYFFKIEKQKYYYTLSQMETLRTFNDGVISLITVRRSYEFENKTYSIYTCGLDIRETQCSDDITYIKITAGNKSYDNLKNISHDNYNRFRYLLNNIISYDLWSKEPPQITKQKCVKMIAMETNGETLTIKINEEGILLEFKFFILNSN